jgi:hypothetical protein
VEATSQDITSITQLNRADRKSAAVLQAGTDYRPYLSPGLVQLRQHTVNSHVQEHTWSGGPVSQHCAASDSPASTCSGCGQPGTLWPPTVARMT